MQFIRSIKKNIKKFKISERLELINIPALIICFAISCFIYYVYRTQTLQDKTFITQLKIVELSGFVHAGKPSKQDILINVVGEPTEVSSLTVSDFEPYIDLKYISSEGKHDFPIFLKLSDKAKNLISLQMTCNPSHVTLDVEEEATGFIDIEPLVSGKPAKGFEVKSVTISPSQLKVTGPKSKLVSKNTFQTEEVNITNARSSLKNDDVPLKANSLFEKSSDDKVSVEVEIVPIKERRKIDFVKINLINISNELEVKSYTNNLTFEIYGNVADLEAFSPPNDFVVADCSKIHHSGKYNVPISVKLPSNLRLVGEITKNIPVTFNTKSVLVENNTRQVLEDSELDKNKTE